MWLEYCPDSLVIPEYCQHNCKAKAATIIKYHNTFVTVTSNKKEGKSGLLLQQTSPMLECVLDCNNISDYFHFLSD